MSRLVRSLLPPVCAGCGVVVQPGAPPLCGACEQRLPGIPGPRCPRCGFTRLPGLSSPGRCGECEAWPPQPPRAASAWLHLPPASVLVEGLKYRGWTSLAAPMGRQMAAPARLLLPGRACLVPVPLSAARRRERGFNQAELLAHALGRALNWPVVETLERVRQGRRQARSARPERAANVAGAFRVRAASRAGSAARELERHLPLVVVDDVITTGATVFACAETLERSGYRCAGAVSFSRTPPGHPGGGL